MSLNTRGRACLRDVQRVLAEIGLINERYGSDRPARRLSIAAVEPIAERGLMPRLAGFAALEPDIAIEIETSKGRVGVVHADAPRSKSWPAFLARLESNDERVLEHALWSRERVSAGQSERVSGVELVLCGHTPTTRIVEVGNVRFIDTGAVYTQFREARLTMIEIEPDWCRPKSVATST